MEKNLFRGTLRLFILKILSSCNKMHGYALMNKISQLTFNKWKPNTGSIYPLLKKMKKEKLITSIKQKSARKLTQYSITKKGRKFLLEAFNQSKCFFELMQQIKKEKIDVSVIKGLPLSLKKELLLFFKLLSKNKSHQKINLIEKKNKRN